jgi:hypothetical protein
MKQYDAKTFLFSSTALILLLVLVLMTSCAPKEKKPNGINPIANARELGKALGCMFGGCKSEEQIQTEFNKVDRETKADQDKTQPASK